MMDDEMAMRLGGERRVGRVDVVQGKLRGSDYPTKRAVDVETKREKHRRRMRRNQIEDAKKARRANPKLLSFRWEPGGTLLRLKEQKEGGLTTAW